MNKNMERLSNGLIKENPTFVLMLGMCPTLAIVIVASLVTVVEFLMKAYTPDLAVQLGVYIPLIVVNCIILGRAESYASKNPVIPSIFDGIGMGLGFTFGLTCIGIIREILGAGQIFGVQVLSLEWFTLQCVPVKKQNRRLADENIIINRNWFSNCK